MIFAIWLAATAAFAAPFHQLPRTATLSTDFRIAAQDDESGNPVFHADANGDGYPELYAYLHDTVHYETVVKGCGLWGPGGPPMPPMWVDQGANDSLIGAGDFDGDGDDDLLTGHYSRGIPELTLQPGGPLGWEVGIRRRFDGAAVGWVLPDLDVDGLPELALVDGVEVVLVPGVAVFLEPDGGSLLNWEVARLLAPPGRRAVLPKLGSEPHDLDGDGSADLIGTIVGLPGGRSTAFVLPR